MKQLDLANSFVLFYAKNEIFTYNFSSFLSRILFKLLISFNTFQASHVEGVRRVVFLHSYLYVKCF